MLTKALRSAQAFFFALFTLDLYAASSSPVSLVGWPIGTDDMGKAVLDSSVLLGDLLCPSLTRLNLLKGKSELSLLTKLEAKDKDWVLTLKDRQWWDGKTLQASDLQHFLQAEFAQDLSALGFDKVPAFAVAAEGKTVTIRWTEKPVFGPYVFNRIPLRVKSDHRLGYQCVGSLQPVKKEQGWALEGKNTGIHLHKDLPVYLKKYPAPSIAFRFADEMHPPGWARQIEESVSCERPLDLPMITMVAWNPEKAGTKNETFRRAMTHLLPRGSLLRAGAGGLGDLISVPFMRAHPGYKKSLLVLPYDPKTADTLLNQLGFKRSEQDGFRRGPDGQRLELKLATADMSGSALLRKVLDDSFRALGINAQFTEKQDNTVDGILLTVNSSWPEADLSPYLHSRLSQGTWPWSYGDAELDKALDAYKLSLSQEKPDFSLLEKIHELVYKREPFSVLVQHRVCVSIDAGKRSQDRIVIRNPDWFRELFDF